MEEIKKAIERTKSTIEARKDLYYEVLNLDVEEIEDEFMDMKSWKKDLENIRREISRLEGYKEGLEIALGMVEQDGKDNKN